MLSTFLPQGLCTPHSFVSNVVLWSPLTHWISAQKCLLILSNAKYAHVPRCTPSVGSSHCASQTITMSACPPEHCLAAWPEHELHRCRNPVSLSLQGPAWYLIVRFVVLKKKKRRLWTSSLKHSLFSAISTSQFSRSVVSDSLQPHGLQHARPPCPSSTCRRYSNSCPSTQWCHPTISTSVIPFSSSRQSFPELGSFLMSHFFTSGGQSIGVSASASVLPMNIRLISFKMEWLDLLAVQGTLKSLLQHHSLKASILRHSAFFMVQLSHPYMTTGKTIALTRWTTVGKLISLLFKHCLVLP